MLESLAQGVPNESTPPRNVPATPERSSGRRFGASEGPGTIPRSEEAAAGTEQEPAIVAPCLGRLLA